MYCAYVYVALVTHYAAVITNRDAHDNALGIFKFTHTSHFEGWPAGSILEVFLSYLHINYDSKETGNMTIGTYWVQGIFLSKYTLLSSNDSTVQKIDTHYLPFILNYTFS